MYTQNQAYPSQPGYGYPPQQPGYPPQQPGYPPQQPGFAPQQPGYPPAYGSAPTQPPLPPLSGGGGGLFGDPVGLFAEKAIRQAFISKVYSILTMQLIFTSILIGIFVLQEDTKKYFQGSPGWMFLGLGIFLVSYLILVCSESARRSSPCNMILLCILTFGYGLEAAIISCHYDTRTVLFAFVATGISCFLIFLFAKTTSLDLTSCGTTLCLLGLGHMIIGMLMIAILVPLGYADVVPLVISISGALLVSLYLVFDLQLIMGGRKCELSPEEYILAAVMLYVDIIQIFLYLLQIIGKVSEDK
uniref:Protein lifeguard 2 n=1 Tax=Aceria tosichella TaxID=561515 RepID=A0A6G1SIW4_9ACAR